MLNKFLLEKSLFFYEKMTLNMRTNKVCIEIEQACFAFHVYVNNLLNFFVKNGSKTK